MKTETKILGVIFILTAILLAGGVFFLARKGDSGVKGTQAVQIDYSKGQKIGSDSAKVKLVEWSDFQCPACAAVEPILKNIRNKENVQFIYRHFPLPQHKYAVKAVNLAEAAGKIGKFWEVHDKLFETQSAWQDLPDAADFFKNLAPGVEFEENTYGDIIEADLLEGQRLGVNATPTFFLNGVKLNLQRFEDLDKLVEEELKK
jgi:protein-disulfide isomerase